jgi:regulator of protease activity HflC (stomatin/prohibitin superfamily)
MNMLGNPLWIAAVFVVIFFLSKWVNILNEYERAVTFWLGRLGPAPKGPGLTFIFWPFETMVRVDLRTITLDVPPQDVITRDNVSRKSTRWSTPVVAGQGDRFGGELHATSQLAQTTLRSISVRPSSTSRSPSERLNERLQEEIDRHTDPWGVKISMVEVKNVDLSQDIQRAMARQAEAEREKRAKIIHAEGELQASKALAGAAEIISANNVTLQLRYLQTLTEIAAEKNSTIVFPLPIDLISALLKK